MNILFVCTANRLRSRTAYNLFKELYPQHNIDSCGISKYAVEQTQKLYWEEAKVINRKLLDNSDVIYCMNWNHQEFIKKKFGREYLEDIIVLDIEDIYNYNDEELKDLLRLKITI